MESIMSYIIGIIICIFCLGILYFVYTKGMYYSRIFSNVKQKRDYPENQFVIGKRYLLGVILSGLVLIILSEYFWGVSYEILFCISMSWGFFCFWMNAWVKKHREKKENVSINLEFSKEEWMKNVLDKVPLYSFESDNFSDLDGIRRGVGEGIHYFRSQCCEDDSECNIYRVEVENNNIIALKLKCMLKTTEDGLKIDYQLSDYKTKFMWTAFLFAIPIIVIWAFIMPIAILLLLIPIGFIFFIYRRQKHVLVHETIAYLEDLSRNKI